MAVVEPFQALRYAPASGPPGNLVTQPYDKITPGMRQRYLGLSPYNLVRIILGEPAATDHEGDNVYTRAGAFFRDWVAKEVLVREPAASFYPYCQQFIDPDTGERLTRTGFIGLGPVVEYAAGIVHRHEQTLSGPRKDRLELLRHTQAHFGQLFMLYPDREGSVDALIEEVADGEPLAEVSDEYGCLHRLWRLSKPQTAAELARRMADKKLLIADGHHRYETALAYSNECPLESARRVMMTFVNMYSPGLRILATHRLVSGVENLDPAGVLGRLGSVGRIERLDPVEAFKAQFAERQPGTIRVGVAFAGQPDVHLLETERGRGMLDVQFVHQQILGTTLGIDEESVREERHLRYVRGIDAALEVVRRGQAQVALLLQPTTVEQVAEISFGGGVMPQKSTDFYPKLLSGLTIYALE